MYKPVPLVSVFKCSRPVVLLNDDADFPLSIRGSAFLVDIAGTVYGITARHVLAGYEVGRMRLQYRPDSSQMLPVRRFHFRPPSAPAADDDERFDIIAMEVDMPRLEAELFGEYQPYKLGPNEPLLPYDAGDNYGFHGWPNDRRDVDYERKHFETAAVLADSRYIGETSRIGIHEINVNRSDEIGSLDGFSGAPVFQVTHLDATISRPTFAGMLLRGSTTGGSTAYFLDRLCIAAFLSLCIAHQK
ncbi:hypothetical protein PHO31112_01651 [Pandoraea horticolens]|uniref:Trypsin-like peptidase domain-containing protein n=1 Tax=Pandoraea horticolens TaxID=2508298 RepID=A0A5E4TY07_9BURK|nr:hypothetical protein [Pandoraea horticolens]VVD91628.1 hypothetical protein PHO31112_01651 [Pandoraea horticolens]